MIVDTPAVGEPLRRVLSVRRWALWSIPAPARLFMLLSEVAAAGITITLLLVRPVSLTDLLRVGVLAALAIGYAEGTARIERLKRYLCSGKTFSNQVSVWICAGVLTVPAGWAATLVAMIYAHLLVQRCRDKSNHPYRMVFTASTELLAALAAVAVLAAAGGGDPLRGGLLAPVAVVVALLVYTVTNFGLVLIGMWLTLRPPSMRTMLPETDVIGYQMATLGLGIVAAEFVLHTLALTPVVVGLAICLHRSSLVTGLRRSARTDTKTGLLNHTAWTEHANGILSRCHRDHQPVAVLFCDLDNFKSVNDTHGHLAGDQVLVAVADCFRRELRGHDGIGRYGGEEFVVVLDRLTRSQAHLVADRLRIAIGDLHLDHDLQITVSIGLAHDQPDHRAPTCTNSSPAPTPRSTRPRPQGVTGCRRPSRPHSWAPVTSQRPGDGLGQRRFLDTVLTRCRRPQGFLLRGLARLRAVERKNEQRSPLVMNRSPCWLRIRVRVGYDLATEMMEHEVRGCTRRSTGGATIQQLTTVVLWRRPPLCGRR